MSSETYKKLWMEAGRQGEDMVKGCGTLGLKRHFSESSYGPALTITRLMIDSELKYIRNISKVEMLRTNIVTN